ncbi:CPBP family intramembrane metalloprotease [Gemmata sp. JC673]|uniref:CPBP family intramembrane metalloprotease n=1 Tax=Gemmata algarum TaxID=2975278 RepID=A0ABU5F0Y7_9BACT|nr:CPBP family intramembrane glutamic endopeptidase [Gemmata algarum]MDY3561235.1 CPBP family intramembrane metalloprotease [Gemmata algarum]
MPIVHPVRRLLCRRCGETAEPVAGQCPWCGNYAEAITRPHNRRRPARARPVRASFEEDAYEDRRPVRPEYAIPVRRPYLIPPLVVVAVAYFGLLASLVGCAVIVAIGGMTEGDDLLAGQAFAEVVTTGLTLLALGLAWKASRQKVPEGTTALTWAASFPLLCILLVLNLAFFTLLRELLKPLGAPEPERMKLTLITVLLICVQPGIVEELFFRQMTLGVLRRSLNVHLAIWLTAVAFAGAHLGNILGMPYLFLVGGFFGYARVYGGLPLAVLLHFLHNLAVVAYDAYRPFG